MPQESTDLRPAGTTPLAATYLGFGAAEVGGPYGAVSDRAVSDRGDSAQTVEAIIRRPVRRPVRHADQHAEALIRDDAPTTG